MFPWFFHIFHSFLYVYQRVSWLDSVRLIDPLGDVRGQRLKIVASRKKHNTKKRPYFISYFGGFAAHIYIYTYIYIYIEYHNSIYSKVWVVIFSCRHTWIITTSFFSHLWWGAKADRLPDTLGQRQLRRRVQRCDPVVFDGLWIPSTIDIYTISHLYVYIYIYVYVYVCVYTYMHIYIYTHVHNILLYNSICI